MVLHQLSIAIKGDTHFFHVVFNLLSIVIIEDTDFSMWIFHQLYITIIDSDFDVACHPLSN